MPPRFLCLHGYRANRIYQEVLQYHMDPEVQVGRGDQHSRCSHRTDPGYYYFLGTQAPVALEVRGVQRAPWDLEAPPGPIAPKYPADPGHPETPFLQLLLEDQDPHLHPSLLRDQVDPVFLAGQAVPVFRGLRPVPAVLEVRKLPGRWVPVPLKSQGGRGALADLEGHVHVHP